ncbi:MAG: roadblock/LC7 domain-containing protein [Deltaproteobacteria bacterium]|nr:roadblock/LC7 domain-containing protein [Deltaproteobacteria bacterium]
MFRTQIDHILENCEGALAGTVMGFDGVSLEAVSTKPNLDVKMVSTEFSFVLSQVRKAAEILEVGGLEEVSIRSEHLDFLVRVLNTDYFLAIIMAPDGNLGKGRFLMRLAQTEIRPQLDG